MAGRYRAPDEKTIRVLLDRLDPRALARALLGRPGGVRGYRARRAARQREALARGRLRAVAVDGKTSRGARRPDGTRVHLLGVAEHGGRLLDHVKVDVKHNETSHFTELPGSLDLDGAVVTFDALHTVRANLDWLVSQKNAQYIAVVKRSQPLLHAQVRALPWRQVPAGSVTRERGHGRAGTRTIKAAHVSGLDFPHARQAVKITRWRQEIATGRASRETVHPPAAPAAGRPTWPPSAQPSARPSRTPATCTSPKADATTPPGRNPPPPRLRLGQMRTFTEHAGALLLPRRHGPRRHHRTSAYRLPHLRPPLRPQSSS
jgi:predicted transposase YbfD/YdcC